LDAENVKVICDSSKKDVTSAVARNTVCFCFCNKSAWPGLLYEAKVTFT